MEANKLAVSKVNKKHKIITVQIVKVIKYPPSSRMLLFFQKNVPFLLFFWRVFELVFEFDKSIMQPY